ncbi:hypothetical protein [Rhodobacter sp. NTK016B]|uniref:hypothetical protein n=1 Tax=Rhodobacter sp. NTK016B TaxID=2759676 RepID=UPI001B7D7D07|nr:hypothetical protein [Rhodobacter sp. NTK016B]
MTLPKIDSKRFTTETGLRITVQVPESYVQKIVDAVVSEDRLKYGDYDSVSWRSAPGIQQFRSLGGGRNTPAETAVTVPCVELSFFLSGDEAGAARVIETLYTVHPYEEPVIFVTPCMRMLHIRGLDEDNPNRFWNNPPEAWVPEDHR